MVCTHGPINQQSSPGIQTEAAAACDVVGVWFQTPVVFLQAAAFCFTDPRTANRTRHKQSRNERNGLCGEGDITSSMEAEPAVNCRC